MKTMILLAAVLLSSAAFAQELTYPPKPAERGFIVDEAGLLSPGDVAKIKEICDKLLTDKKVPIIVVTIPSMAKYGAAGWDIVTYAQNLFNNWGIGFKEWNYGILLVVSAGDRKARIELGREWNYTKDAECQQIMGNMILPAFKAGDFSGGILAGVKALDAIARGLKSPAPARPPVPWWHYAIGAGLIVLLVSTVVSLIQRGSSGWGWLLWAAIFGIIGYILYSILTSSSRGGRGGGFGGGSFGGGFSGGGGASGSW